MKIQKIQNDKYNNLELIFTNGKKITYYHCQDCCEDVYAAFDEIEEVAMEHEFHEPLIFESVKDYGFRFGNKEYMVSVPCYNIQNGYYSDDLEIKYGMETVIEDCEKQDHIY